MVAMATPTGLISLLLLINQAAVQGKSLENAENTLDEHDEPRASSEDADASLLGSDLRFVFRLYSDCAAKDAISCLKTKLVTALDRAARNQGDLKVMDGVRFVRDSTPGKALDDDEGQALSEAELEASLPRNLQDKEDLLDNMIVEKLLGFFRTHTLQLRLPTAEELQRSLTEEARGKKKKGSGLLLLPLMMAGTMIPIALGGLALLAGKALIISKLALVLAGILGLKKLLSSSSGGHESHGYGRRSMDVQDDNAHMLAYRAYNPKQA